MAMVVQVSGTCKYARK